MTSGEGPKDRPLGGTSEQTSAGRRSDCPSHAAQSSARGSDDITESPTSPRMPPVPLALSAAASTASQLGSFSALSATQPWPMRNPFKPRKSLRGLPPKPLRPTRCRKPRQTRPALLGTIWWWSWDSSPMGSLASSSRTTFGLRPRVRVATSASRPKESARR
jgi:hypothetical protein